MKYAIGILGLILTPLAIVWVAWRSSCKFVTITALEEFKDD